MLLVTVARSSSDDSACTSGFVDDVMFHIMEPIDQNQRRHMFLQVRQVAAPTAKVLSTIAGLSL